MVKDSGKKDMPQNIHFLIVIKKKYNICQNTNKKKLILTSNKLPIKGKSGYLPDNLRSVKVVAAIRNTIEIATQKCWLQNQSHLI
jgi:hypothetical protein